MRLATALTSMLVMVLTGCGDSSEPTATYTGDGCEYDGPSDFDLNSSVTFTVINESDSTNTGFAIWKFPSGVTPEEIFEKGIFSAAGPDDELIVSNSRPTPIGEPLDLAVSFDTPGQWGINCFFFTDDASPGNDYTTMFTVNE